MNTAQAAWAKEELLRQACLNAVLIESPAIPPYCVTAYLRGRFGRTFAEGTPYGVSDFVNVIRAEYRNLVELDGMTI